MCTQDESPPMVIVKKKKKFKEIQNLAQNPGYIITVHVYNRNHSHRKYGSFYAKYVEVNNKLYSRIY